MLKRRNCSGVSARANALRALSTSLRSPMLALPLHSRTLGRVMISICVRPASWLSAENELVRKRILADLLARRQAAAPEAVHLEGGARAAGHLLQHLGELVGIVGQGVDLGLLERRRLRVAAAIVERARGVVDDHFFLQAGDAERHVLVVGAAASA
jgi:hypothetical protein